MRRNVYRLVVFLLIASMGLYGCEGSSSTTAPAAATATGRFVDAPVEGLKYVSGEQNGFTGPNGEFTYEVGQAVTFSVGGVVIGQARGASVITPIELVKAANPGTTVTASTPAVVRISQFLLTASSLTSTGIRIDPTAAAASATHNINISTAPASSFIPLIGQIAATAGNRTVTTSSDAQNHITASMNCLSSGTVVLPPASSTGGGNSEPPSAVVNIYKYVGSVQCAGGGTSIPAMQQQLTDAGIQVLTASCGVDGKVYAAVCGGGDGRIGIFEVPATQAQAALALGFAPLSNLPDAARLACQVSLYKYIGSVQCTGGGTSIPAMQQQLTDAGIQVLTASCGADGKFYAAMCGIGDGRIGIFEVPATQAQTALALSFAPLSNLPDAARLACL